MKPILFNTDMVRAILDRRKTVTRRVVKPQPYADERKTMANTQPYRPGDILYVRETWAKIDGEYVFRADDEMPEGWHLTAWHPSIHMPREAARIFLRVKDVRVERLRGIGHDDIAKEGIVTKGSPGSPERVNPYFAFKSLWDSTIKKSDSALYGWDANPWVCVIAFERISREEAVK